MAPWRLLCWPLMIQVGAGWWFLDQGGYVPGLGPNDTSGPPFHNDSLFNSSTDASRPTDRTWWYWGSGFPWWAEAGPNVSDPPLDESASPLKKWFVWGFRFIAWAGGARVFSTPDHSGSLKVHGGWLLFLVDMCGVGCSALWAFRVRSSLHLPSRPHRLVFAGAESLMVLPVSPPRSSSCLDRGEHL